MDLAERQEYHRLLYVGMTRARDRLYICGWQGVNRREKDPWYDLVSDGLDGQLTELEGHDGKPVRRTGERANQARAKIRREARGQDGGAAAGLGARTSPA